MHTVHPQLADTDLRPLNGVDKQQQHGLQGNRICGFHCNERSIYLHLVLVQLLGLALLRQRARQLPHKWDNGVLLLVEVNNNGAQQLEPEANSDINNKKLK